MDLRNQLINNDNSTIVSDDELKASENYAVRELVADQMYIPRINFKQDPKVYDDVNRDALTIQFEAKHANGGVVTLNQAAMIPRPGEDIQQVYTRQFAAKAQEADRKVTDDLQAQVNCFSQQALYYARFPFEKALERTVEHPSLAGQVVIPKNYNATMHIPADVSKPLTLQVFATDFPIRAMVENKPCLAMVKGTISYEAVIEPITPSRYQDLLAIRAERAAPTALGMMRSAPKKTADSELPRYILRVTSIKASNPLLREILKRNCFPKDLLTKAEYKDHVVYPDRAFHEQEYLAQNPVPPRQDGSRLKAFGWGLLGGVLTCTLIGIIPVVRYGIFGKSKDEYQRYQAYQQDLQRRQHAVDEMVRATTEEYMPIFAGSLARAAEKMIALDFLRRPEAPEFELNRQQVGEARRTKKSGDRKDEHKGQPNQRNRSDSESESEIGPVRYLSDRPTQGSGTSDPMSAPLPGQVNTEDDHKPDAPASGAPRKR